MGSALFLSVCVRRMRCSLQVLLAPAAAFPARCRTCSSKGKHLWVLQEGALCSVPIPRQIPAAVTPPPQQQPFAECWIAPSFTLSEALFLQCSAHSCCGNQPTITHPKNNPPKKEQACSSCFSVHPVGRWRNVGARLKLWNFVYFGC